ncbi:MAG: hypothetical protein AB7U82_16445 [Blastocatellales bacterium]
MSSFKPSRAEAAALLIILLLVSAQLMWPPMIGIASNGDFDRLMHWGKFEYVTTDHDEKYFNWINREFRITKSPWLAWRGFGSSEATFIKLSAIIGDWIFPGDGFDLRMLGAIHLLAFAAAFWLLMRGWRASVGISPLFLLPGFLLTFCDIGYTAYFNSFYSETSSLIFLLAMTGAGLRIASQPEKQPRRAQTLAVFCLCAGLFIAAKPQNFTLIAPLLLLCASLFRVENSKPCRVILIAFALSLISAAISLNLIAPWYTHNGRYQSVFYGILKDSPTPEQDLRDLGLNEKFAALADTTIFHNNLPIDIKGQEFRAEFYQRINHLKITKFYLTHPSRFLTKLQIVARDGYQLRPNLGNFEKATGAPPRTESHRWSLWSGFKQRYWPKSLWFLAAYCLLLLFLIIKGYRKSPSRLPRDFCLTLWAMMILAFVTPIIGDGQSDLIRHMFLFNALFDLSLLILSGLLLNRLWRAVAGAVLKSPRQLNKTINDQNPYQTGVLNP